MLTVISDGFLAATFLQILKIVFLHSSSPLAMKSYPPLDSVVILLFFSSVCLLHTPKSHFTHRNCSLIIVVGFETFFIKHWPAKVKFITHPKCPQSLCPQRKKKNKRTMRQRPPQTVCGGGHSPCQACNCYTPSFSFACVAENNSGCYMKMCSTASTKDLTYLP